MSTGGATSSGRPGDGPGGGLGPRAGHQSRDGAAGRQGRDSVGQAGRAARRGRGPEPIAVTWHEGQRRPVAFVWRGRRYRVERLLEVWVVETGWWKDQGRVSRSCWRGRAGGRVFDLRYDRIARAWALEQALN